MKTLLKIGEMLPYLPPAVKDAINHVAKDAGQKTDDLELHRHTHSEKSKVNELDPTSRKSLAYVSYRTQDRDDEIVIPKALKLDEFRKYMSVLVNHNYSLLPVGSDETIEADDFGIKALTVHADTGTGTMANVVWDLVRQGHLKGRSVGFVPTSYTKPGARDWDHVTNQLQSNWGEFDKAKAEKSISRIITGGVLLEHSFVSVPCNVDAELIGTVKAMHLDGKIIKQLGWEMKDGILVNKAEMPPAEKVPCACDECGYVADALAGSKCPECKTGDMKAKGKEKAIEISDKGGAGSGNFGHSGGEGGPGNPGGSGGSGGGTVGVPSKEAVSRIDTILGKFDNADRDTGSEDRLLKLRDEIQQAKKVTQSQMEDIRFWEKEKKIIPDSKLPVPNKGFHSHAVEKPNPHMPGGSFSACVLIMEDKGHETESAKKICGALQADAGGKGLTEAETKAVQEVTGKAVAMPCVCDECGAEGEDEGSDCTEPGCDGKMRAKKEEKEYTPEITVVKPAPSVKILFAPPTGDMIAAQVGDAVERALSRRTGKIL